MHKISDNTWQYLLKDHGEDTTALVQFIHIMTKFRPDVGAQYIYQTKSYWPPDIREDVLKLCDPNAESFTVKMHSLMLTRRVFTIAAWFAGASWGQLGIMFKVSSQSIIASVNKLISANTRQSMLGMTGDRQRMSYTQVEAMWDRFNQMLKVESIETIAKVPYLVLAGMLHESAVAAEDSLVIHSRIAGMERQDEV